MKSIFLKLSSFRFGAARRHCPFTSIIHKSISFLFALIFFSLHCFLVPVSALADPKPEYDPVYNTEIIRLADYVDNELTPDQQDIFYIMFGAYLVAQGAMQDSLLEDPYTTQDGVLGWLKSCGIQIYNSAIVQNVLMSPSLLIQQGIQDLVDIGMGLAIKAGLYQDKVTFTNDVMSSDFYFLPFNKGIQIGINQVLASNGGLFDWQDDIPFEFTNNFHWYNQGIPDLYLTSYYSAVDTLSMPRHFATRYPESTNRSAYVVSTLNGIDKFDLFIDTTNNIVSFHESGPYSVDYVYFYSYDYTIKTGNANVTIGSVPYDPSLFSNYTDIIQYAFNQDWTQSSYKLLSFANYGTVILNSMEFVNKIYIGSSWENRQLFTPNMTLNFTDKNILYYLQLQNDYLLDLKGIIQDLIDVTVLKPVIYDNIYDPSGVKTDPVTQSVSVTVQFPDSGIIVPSGLFGSSKGFIDYLWYMTKPLVQYTHDLLGTMWFDGVDGFDFSGPAPIVFGVISLGLIGGLIVKFLL